MGFTSGIYVAKKDNTFQSSVEYFIADEYCSWITSDINRKNYKTFLDFAKAMCYNDVANEDVCSRCEKYAIKNTIQDEFGNSTVFKEIASWCSLGAIFHEKILDIIGDSGYITKDSAIKILKYAHDIIDNILIPVKIKYSFKEDESCGEDELKLTSCDGVELTDEFGNIKRIYTDDESDSMLLSIKDNCDLACYYSYTSLINAMINTLSTVDFDKQVVLYIGGY